MPLDPEIATVLDALKGMKPMEEMTLEELRASMSPLPPERRAPVGATEDRTIANGVPVRIYRPETQTAETLVLYFHGGGFVIGNLESHDHVARDLCNATGGPVVAVDYRLAPEHKFPAGPDDCLAAAHWAAAAAAELGSSPRRLVLAGDSAGATLAAVTSLRLRDEGGQMPAGQVLAYPVTAYHTPPTQSYLDNASGYSLTRNAMIRFWADYVTSPEDAQHPHAAPLLAPELTGLPPALVLTAEFDPLRDEGDAYAERLAAAGVAVTHRRYEGLIHGFMRMSAVSTRAREILAETGAWIRDLPPAQGSGQAPS